ncbi:MAG: proprotein convertase P-domain protein, partial [Chloracidobacterium sp.]
MNDSTSSLPVERPPRRSTWRRLLPLAVAATVFVACVALTFRAPMTRAAGRAAWTAGKLKVNDLNQLSVAGNRVKLMVDAGAPATESLRDAKVISEYEGFRVLEVSEQDAARLVNEPGVTQRNDFNSIYLNAVEINTTSAAARALRSEQALVEGVGMRLVQFAGPVQPSWMRMLEATGVQVVTYVPSNAYLVYGNAKTLGALSALAQRTEAVQWDGPYYGLFKIHPTARPGSRGYIDTGGEYQLQLFNDQQGNRGTFDLLQTI